MKKNIIVRKSLLYLNYIPRFLNRIYSKNSYKPILVNSFPKSGTHLLYQVFFNQCFIKDYKVFIASMPSISKQPIKELDVIDSVNKITNSELVRSHIYYSKALDFTIKNKCVHYFIYRDPRDVVVSEANYLFNMNKWHRLHGYFKKYKSLEDRIKFAILGNEFHKTNTLYGNINSRYLDYIGWIKNPNVFSVKYEDLIGSHKESKLEEIINYYLLMNNNVSIDFKQFFLNSISSINPSKSHTFHSGGSGKWKNFFNNEHKDLFKKYAGDLLVNLGYENDLNW